MRGISLPAAQLFVIAIENILRGGRGGGGGQFNQDKFKIKRGEVFGYLGMDIDFKSCPCMLITSVIK